MARCEATDGDSWRARRAVRSAASSRAQVSLGEGTVEPIWCTASAGHGRGGPRGSHLPSREGGLVHETEGASPYGCNVAMLKSGLAGPEIAHRSQTCFTRPER